MANPGSGEEGEFFAVRGLVPSREDVAADVRKVVGGCRSRGDFQRLVTPALDQLLALRQLGHDDGPELVARAITAVEPERYRRFLEILLPLPFHEGERWSALGPSRQGPGRGDRAATVFGLDTWDGCTRTSITLDDRSRRDWAELHLATALIHVATTDDVATLDEAPASPPVESRWRPRVSVLIAAAVGLVVAAAILVYALGRPDESEQSQGRAAPTTVASSVPGGAGVLPETCVAIGQLDAALSASPDAEVRTSTLQDTYTRAAPTPALECAIAPAYAWEGMTIQELDSGEEDLPAALALSNPTTGFLLTPSQWGTYRRLGSGDGTRVEDVGGAPTRITDRTDGGVEIELSRGVLMVGESDDAPFFWIPKEFVQFWRDHQEVGRPTGNPLLPGSQDFQYGSAALELTSPVPVIQIAPDPAAQLPPPADRREHILHQADGTAWWIDADDHRHWIATGAVFGCLGGDEVLHPEDVPGFAIASLPAGDHAECPGE